MSKVTGFYNHYDEAEKAVKALEEKGMDSHSINLIPQESNPTKEPINDVLFGKMENANGRYLVSVKTRSEAEERQIRDILSNAGAVHLETR